VNDLKARMVKSIFVVAIEVRSLSKCKFAMKQSELRSESLSTLFAEKEPLPLLRMFELFSRKQSRNF
jgi:hypothetical protein